MLLNDRIQLVALLMRCLVPQALKRWCTQILSALKWVSSFHECSIQHARCNQCSQVIFTNTLCGGGFFFFFCSYLHSCDPPIIHGNLTCDTIFIQHNGLIKIGSGIIPRDIADDGAFKNLQQTSFYTHFIHFLITFTAHQ